MKSKPFDFIRNLIVAETKSDDFEKVLDAGGVSANVYLRRLGCDNQTDSSID